jgi:hypothetical protein
VKWDQVRGNSSSRMRRGRYYEIEEEGKRREGGKEL